MNGKGAPGGAGRPRGRARGCLLPDVAPGRISRTLRPWWRRSPRWPTAVTGRPGPGERRRRAPTADAATEDAEIDARPIGRRREQLVGACCSRRARRAARAAGRRARRARAARGRSGPAGARRRLRARRARPPRGLRRRRLSAPLGAGARPLGAPAAGRAAAAPLAADARDAGDRRLPPAVHAGRDRGHPRRRCRRRRHHAARAPADPHPGPQGSSGAPDPLRHHARTSSRCSALPDLQALPPLGELGDGAEAAGARGARHGRASSRGAESCRRSRSPAELDGACARRPDARRWPWTRSPAADGAAPEDPERARACASRRHAEDADPHRARQRERRRRAELGARADPAARRDRASTANASRKRPPPHDRRAAQAARRGEHAAPIPKDVRPSASWLAARRRRLYPIGRLDLQSTGVLLLTNDGALAQGLLHPQRRSSASTTSRCTARPDGRVAGAPATWRAARRRPRRAAPGCAS